MPGIATPLAQNLGGYAGEARLYRLDPPLQGEEHVIVWVQTFGVPEACVVIAHPSGAAKTMNRMPGSYVHPQPSHAGALFLAGYEIGPQDPEPVQEPPAEQEPEPPAEPEPESVFDPSQATVPLVLEYLSTAPESEQQRVVLAEQEGKARKGILSKHQLAIPDAEPDALGGN